MWRGTHYPLRDLRRHNSPFVWEREARKKRDEEIRTRAGGAEDGEEGGEGSGEGVKAKAKTHCAWGGRSHAFLLLRVALPLVGMGCG